MPAANMVGIFWSSALYGALIRSTKNVFENHIELLICVLLGIVCKVTFRSAKGPIAQSVRAHR